MSVVVVEKKKRAPKVHNHCASCGGPVAVCHQCQNITFCDMCGSCNIHGILRKREEPTREFLVEATFYPKKQTASRLSYEGKKVVKAFSLQGAIRKGSYELKKEVVPARKQLVGVRVMVTPLAAKKKERCRDGVVAHSLSHPR